MSHALERCKVPKGSHRLQGQVWVCTACGTVHVCNLDHGYEGLVWTFQATELVVTFPNPYASSAPSAVERRFPEAGSERLDRLQAAAERLVAQKDEELTQVMGAVEVLRAGYARIGLIPDAAMRLDLLITKFLETVSAATS